MAGLTAIKRKGFKGGGADASTTSFSKSFDRQHGTNTASRANKSVDRRQAAGQRDADNTNRRIQLNRLARQDAENKRPDVVKKNPFKKTFDVAGSVFDFGRNYLTSRKKGLYNIVRNNPEKELQFLSQLQITNPAKYNSLPQNLKDLLENTQYDMSGSFKDQPKFSFDDFQSLTQFDDGAFAKYARERGSPGLSVSGDMSKVGMKSVRKDKFGKPVKDIFGNTLFDYGDPISGGGGNYYNQFQLNNGLGEEEVQPIIDETQTFEFDPNRFGKGGDSADVTRASYIFNQGGRVPRNMGGIMNVVPRQAYGLGDIVKSITKPFKGIAKAAGKVLKSDLGKAAMLYAGGVYLGGGNIFSAGAYNPANFLGKKGYLANIAGKALLKDPTKGFGVKDNLSLMKIMGLSAALPFIPGINKVPENEDIGMADRGGRLIDPLTGEEGTPQSMRANIENAKIEANGDPVKLASLNQKYNNMLFSNLPYENYGTYAQGGRIKAQEGGLMNLGGMEKDYRAEGGFVPIGREEKADDVPARLSVNEFVFTADAVRNAGGGDIDRGAEVMENMMKNLENGGTVSEESQGNTGAQNMFSVSERIGEVI
jgi:hypothetical protein